MIRLERVEYSLEVCKAAADDISSKLDLLKELMEEFGGKPDRRREGA